MHERIKITNYTVAYGSKVASAFSKKYIILGKNQYFFLFYMSLALQWLFNRLYSIIIYGENIFWKPWN